MTWRAGPPRVATRHRGHMAAPGWPAQEAQGAQPSGREATQPRGRPCGVPRGDSGKEEIGQLIGEFTPPIYTRQFVFFSPCGTMFPHGLTLEATWTRGERRISSWTATIAWTRVHAISNSGTCRKYKGKWPDLRTYLTTRGRLSVIQLSSSLIHRRSGSWTSPRCTDGGDASRYW